MWSFMESARPSVFTSSNLEGVERVVKEKGKYSKFGRCRYYMHIKNDEMKRKSGVGSGQGF